MTITTHDGFALTPKRCNKCNRLFILESYDIYYKQVGIGYLDLMQIKCNRCNQKEGVKSEHSTGILESD